MTFRLKNFRLIYITECLNRIFYEIVWLTWLRLWVLSQVPRNLWFLFPLTLVLFLSSVIMKESLNDTFFLFKKRNWVKGSSFEWKKMMFSFIKIGNEGEKKRTRNSAPQTETLITTREAFLELTRGELGEHFLCFKLYI